MPWYQWFGSGFGKAGSTSKRGTCTLPPLPACASARFSSSPCPIPSASSNAASVVPIAKLRFISAPWISTLHEFLYALALVGFSGVDGALRVHGDAADAVELARVAATLAEAADRVERRAIEDPHLLVVAVGDVELTLIRRERDVPHRTVALRLLRHDPFLDEFPVLLEDLQAIVLAVADVDHAVLRQLDAGDRLERLAVRFPLALERSAVGVEDGNPSVAIVGHVDFVRRVVDGNGERAIEIADGRHVLARLVELEDDRARRRRSSGGTTSASRGRQRRRRETAANVHVPRFVDRNARRIVRPVVAAAALRIPVRHQVAGRVERKHLRRGEAARARPRFERRTLLVVLQRVDAAVDDPDAVLAVGGDAGDRSEDPVLRHRERLWPQRFDLELRRLCAAAALLRDQPAAGRPSEHGDARDDSKSASHSPSVGSIKRSRWPLAISDQPLAIAVARERYRVGHTVPCSFFVTGPRPL